MFAYNNKDNDNEDIVEHFGKRKKSSKISAGAIAIILLVIIAIALFAYLSTKIDKSGATQVGPGAPPAAAPSVLSAKPATGGYRGRK